VAIAWQNQQFKLKKLGSLFICLNPTKKHYQRWWNHNIVAGEGGSIVAMTRIK